MLAIRKSEPERPNLHHLSRLCLSRFFSLFGFTCNTTYSNGRSNNAASASFISPKLIIHRPLGLLVMSLPLRSGKTTLMFPSPFGLIGVVSQLRAIFGSPSHARILPPRYRRCLRPSRHRHGLHAPWLCSCRLDPTYWRVCKVCLSDPEQADVPPQALWEMIVTSLPRRLSSTAARRPAAPLPTMIQPLRTIGIICPNRAMVSGTFGSDGRRGIVTSVRLSRMALDILLVTVISPSFYSVCAALVCEGNRIFCNL